MNTLEKEQEFKEWLEQGRYEKGTIGSRIANCKTVNNKYDLYQYFKEGNTQEIYRLFTYSTDDMDSGLKPLHAIPIDGNPRTGTSTYKSAIKLYFTFLEEYAEEHGEKIQKKFGNIFKEEEFKNFLPKNDVSVDSISSYLNYIKNADRLLEYKVFPIVEKLFQTQDTEGLEILREKGINYLDNIDKGSKIIRNYKSGFNKYLDFIESAIVNLIEVTPDSNIEDIVDELIDETIDDVTTEVKDKYSHEDIRENFFFRLISQNRFNKSSDFYFPIRFIQQYFYKTEDKKYFDDIINEQIDHIQFFYAKDQWDEIKHLKELSIADDGSLLINGKALFSEDFQNNRTFVPFKISKLSEIAIDHKESMDSILNNLKGENYSELVKITEALKKGLHKKTYKKLAARGTKLSNDKVFRSSIDRVALKREFENIINKMQLQLMHKSHNNYKRNKV